MVVGVVVFIVKQPPLMFEKKKKKLRDSAGKSLSPTSTLTLGLIPGCYPNQMWPNETHHHVDLITWISLNNVVKVSDTVSTQLNKVSTVFFLFEREILHIVY